MRAFCCILLLCLQCVATSTCSYSTLDAAIASRRTCGVVIPHLTDGFGWGDNECEDICRTGRPSKACVCLYRGRVTHAPEGYAFHDVAGPKACEKSGHTQRTCAQFERTPRATLDRFEALSPEIDIAFFRYLYEAHGIIFCIALLCIPVILASVSAYFVVPLVIALTFFCPYVSTCLFALVQTIIIISGPNLIVMENYYLSGFYVIVFSAYTLAVAFNQVVVIYGILLFSVGPIWFAYTVICNPIMHPITRMMAFFQAALFSNMIFICVEASLNVFPYYHLVRATLLSLSVFRPWSWFNFVVHLHDLTMALTSAIGPFDSHIYYALWILFYSVSSCGYLLAVRILIVLADVSPEVLFEDRLQLALTRCVHRFLISLEDVYKHRLESPCLFHLAGSVAFGWTFPFVSIILLVFHAFLSNVDFNFIDAPPLASVVGEARGATFSHRIEGKLVASGQVGTVLVSSREACSASQNIPYTDHKPLNVNPFIASSMPFLFAATGATTRANNMKFINQASLPRVRAIFAWNVEKRQSMVYRTFRCGLGSLKDIINTNPHADPGPDGTLWFGVYFSNGSHHAAAIGITVTVPQSPRHRTNRFVRTFLSCERFSVVDGNSFTGGSDTSVPFISRVALKPHVHWLQGRACALAPAHTERYARAAFGGALTGKLHHLPRAVDSPHPRADVKHAPLLIEAPAPPLSRSETKGKPILRTPARKPNVPPRAGGSTHTQSTSFTFPQSVWAVPIPLDDGSL